MEISQDRDSASVNMKVRHNSYGTSKKQILHAAIKIFSEQGFSRSTLKDVAGYSKANTALIGYHFGNKEGLQKAVVEDLLQRAASALEADLTIDKVDLIHFKKAIESLVIFAEKDDLFFRLLEWSMLDSGSEAEQIFHAFICKLLRRWSDCLTVLRPDLDRSEIEVRTAFIFCSVRQFAHYRILSHSRLAREFYSKEGAEALSDYRRKLMSNLIRLAIE